MTNTNQSNVKTSAENYRDAVIEFRQLSVRDIKIALKQRTAMHSWAVRAYETVLHEKLIGRKIANV